MPERGSFAMPEILEQATVLAIGARAATALEACGGRLAPLADFPDAPYMHAGGEIVWVGTTGPMHPRAIFIATAGLPTRYLKNTAAPWSVERPALAIDEAMNYRRLLSDLLPALARTAGASGLAPLLAGQPPLFPLAARTECCLQASRAALGDDPQAFATAAARLLGAGLGLTPSGDDFVGAALFTLRALHPGEASWPAVAMQLADLAQSRTHSIGAALFADLANGRSFAPLHDLFAAEDSSTFAACANAVAGIGHSSGWDMLAGIVAASIGLPPILSSTIAKDTP